MTSRSTKSKGDISPIVRRPVARRTTIRNRYTAAARKTGSKVHLLPDCRRGGSGVDQLREAEFRAAVEAHPAPQQARPFRVEAEPNADRPATRRRRHDVG